MYVFRWFEPFITWWLEENDRVSVAYMHAAYKKDKADGVREN